MAVPLPSWAVADAGEESSTADSIAVRVNMQSSLLLLFGCCLLFRCCLAVVCCSDVVWLLFVVQMLLFSLSAPKQLISSSLYILVIMLSCL